MARRKRDHDDDLPTFEGPRIRAHEQLLLDAIGELPGGRLLCNTAGRGQFARAYASAFPGNPVVCWFLDVFQRDQTVAAGEYVEGLEFLCAPDLPAETCDVVGWALGFRGENELKWEMLQEGHRRLKPEGRFLAATDKPDDQWLHAEMKKLFPKVTRRPYAEGVLYLATKTEELPKYKNYDCDFAFRDQGRLLQLHSRPSVFSHRRLDTGARRLIDAMEIEPGQRILDIGCGSGAVGLAALARASDVNVFAVDCNPRALQCAQIGADRNGLTGLTTSLDAFGQTVPEGEFDLVLANPPYFSNYRIAELFLEIAAKALRPRGRVLVVTKTPLWYQENMPRYFSRFTLEPVKDYVLISAEHRPRRPKKWPGDASPE